MQDYEQIGRPTDLVIDYDQRQQDLKSPVNKIAWIRFCKRYKNEPHVDSLTRSTFGNEDIFFIKSHNPDKLKIGKFFYGVRVAVVKIY